MYGSRQRPRRMYIIDVRQRRPGVPAPVRQGVRHQQQQLNAAAEDVRRRYVRRDLYSHLQKEHRP